MYEMDYTLLVPKPAMKIRVGPKARPGRDRGLRRISAELNENQSGSLMRK